MYKTKNQQFKRDMIILQPGEFYVTKQDEVISTIVQGSYISVCLGDSKAGIGGMNNFMLPMLPDDFRVEDISDSQSVRYGMHTTELLIS